MADNEGIQVTEAPDCPLCGGNGGLMHGQLRDRYFGAPGLWSFLRCRACGHAWLDPRPEPRDVAKLYPSYWDRYQEAFAPQGLKPRVTAALELYEAANRGTLGALGYESEVRRRRDLWFGRMVLSVRPLKEILEGGVLSLPGPAGGRLLDIGCGDGEFLARMRSLGWNVAGLESDPVAVQQARERNRLTVAEGSIEDGSFPPSSFDAVTMSHVIEHLWEPAQDLRMVRGWLRPGGVLVIRTPNLDSLGHRVFQAAWMPLEPPRHIHLFTPQTLRREVECSGFVVKDLHTSARIAQGVFDSSNAIRTAKDAEPVQKLRSRSLASRLFLINEMFRCSIGEAAGEEIVLVACRETE